jgi:hypothetical protein
MKRTYLVPLFQCLATALMFPQSITPSARAISPFVASPSRTSQADPRAQTKILDEYGRLPLSFEANDGQTDARVKFFSRTSGYSLFLTQDEVVLTLDGGKATNSSPQGLKPASAKGYDTAARTPFPRTFYASRRDRGTAESMPNSVLRMKLRNSNPMAKMVGVGELAGTNNYFIGNDPAKWRTNVPTYTSVKYEGIYSGIDLVYYGNQRQLEYDFVVAPGADLRRIAFDVRGAKRIRRDAYGELIFKMGEDEVRWRKPVVYQEKDGARQLIAARYAITNTNQVGFEVAKYDAKRPLFIDPVIDPLIYSTYLGGSSYDYGFGVALDSAGNAYVTGWTASTDFPTMNPSQPANGGQYDAFVSKINPTGSALVYSTYLGGSGSDGGQGIAVDGEGNAYITGGTTSTDFPTMNPFQAFLDGSDDAFVTKLNSTGSALIYSTYLGGSGAGSGSGIAVDVSGDAYVTGFTSSTDFPVTPGAFQTKCGGTCLGNAFVTKVSPKGSALIYSTYLGGSGVDDGNGGGIVVDSAGNAYVTGGTGSNDFPVTPGAFQTTCGGNNCAYPDFDAFVTKLNPSGSALVYSTHLGGSGDDYGWGIGVDGVGNAYVTGRTSSSDFPTKNPFQSALGGGYDAFVSKLNSSGSALIYSTYLGGSGDEDEFGAAIAVDGGSNAYVVGSSSSTDFPVTPRALQTHWGGHGDAFVTKFNSSGSALFYSTYLGGPGGGRGKTSSAFGIAVDSAGDLYVTGNTNSPNFPTINPLQSAYGGNGDAFVANMHIPVVTTTTTLSCSPNPSTYGQAVTFTAVVSSSAAAPPDGEVVTFMKGKTVLGTGTLSGGSASFTTSTLKVGTTSVKAVYGGDSNFAGSTSKAVKQVVEKAAE